MGNEKVSNPVAQELRIFATAEADPKVLFDFFAISRQSSPDILDGLR
jgi:hypothetical protein